jgi:hypothetical protein
MRKNSLLSSLLLLVNIYQLNYVTAFIIDNAARTTRLLHRQSGLDLNIVINNSNSNNNNRNDEDARWKSSSLTRLHAATSSFDEQSNNHNSNKNKNKSKKTTALNAATGISLPTTLLLDDDISSSDTSSSDMGVGVLFLNLGGPKTGDDVEGTLRVRSKKEKTFRLVNNSFYRFVTFYLRIVREILAHQIRTNHTSHHTLISFPNNIQSFFLFQR